ncbi:hypothetical protein CYL31_11885 [Marinomonas sp. A3A]|uniref:hypothetical protein n=1 Tax=Marinomonas sp. A3A TaxID=2065312 RepID=UPI001BB3DC1C|nr:hypothetical protein [Marinomonas sp. A3A]QUX92069.1 hypothetical protein CYL31_11885 [Marinomonas sp. A3A]
MLATHLDAERRYSIIRKEALAAATEIVQGSGKESMMLSEIDDQALDAFRFWTKSRTRVKDWDWIEGYNSFRFRYPKRFEIALWDKSNLIGLSMGRPTYQGTALRLDVVEAAPSDLGDRPSIFDSVLVAYGIYARLLNAKQIRIMHPVNNEVISYYEKFGYRYVSGGDYLCREIL